ncbi:MAG: hypothetical protein F6J87_18255 [Spirulina sp. SIO3F2]|nr:hypothetical protein [Spirulina sp. SIO3F2]
MKRKTWRDRAATNIWHTITRFYQAQTLPIGATLTPLQLKQLKQALTQNYPFGQRQYYPYKVWLQERKDAIARLTGAPLPQQSRQSNPLPPPGQLTLF